MPQQSPGCSRSNAPTARSRRTARTRRSRARLRARTKTRRRSRCRLLLRSESQRPRRSPACVTSSLLTAASTTTPRSARRPPTSNSTGLALSAFAAAGIAPASVTSGGKSGIDYLRTLQLSCAAASGAGAYDFQTEATLHANDYATVQGLLGVLGKSLPITPTAAAGAAPACPATVTDAASSAAAATSYLSARLIATSGAIPSAFGSGTDWTTTANAVLDLAAAGAGSAAITLASQPCKRTCSRTRRQPASPRPDRWPHCCWSRMRAAPTLPHLVASILRPCSLPPSARRPLRPLRHRQRHRGTCRADPAGYRRRRPASARPDRYLTRWQFGLAAVAASRRSRRNGVRLSAHWRGGWTAPGVGGRPLSGRGARAGFVRREPIPPTVIGLSTWRTPAPGSSRSAGRRVNIPSTAKCRAGDSPSRPKPRTGCRHVRPPDFATLCAATPPAANEIRVGIVRRLRYRRRRTRA